MGVLARKAQWAYRYDLRTILTIVSTRTEPICSFVFLGIHSPWAGILTHDRLSARRSAAPR